MKLGSKVARIYLYLYLNLLSFEEKKRKRFLTSFKTNFQRHAPFPVNINISCILIQNHMKHFNDAHVEFTLKEKKMDEEN
jgi:hypothetical protein